MRILRLLAAVVAAILVSSFFLAAPAQAVKATDTGHKHVAVSQTADGSLRVAWNPTSGVKNYLVKTSSTPDMVQNVKTYKVAKSLTTKTVPPTRYAVAGTGNYTFVRVYAVKANGKTGESPYVQVRMDTAAPDAASTPVTVATFNVRTAENDVAGHSWSSRSNVIASQIQQSGASVVALQEAGAKIGTDFTVNIAIVAGTKVKSKDFYWQFEQIRDKVGGSYQLADSNEYVIGSQGKEGSRILFDAAKVTMVDQGNFSIGGVTGKDRYVGWAEFTDNATGKRFAFLSTHLTANEDNRAASDAALAKVRVKQAKLVIAKVKAFAATGEQVIVAGDFNSNIYSAPNNAVDRAFIDAGFYDAYATAKNTNEFYVTFNDFAKPKKSASRTDYILTYGGPKGSFSYKNWIVRTGTIPSDHYMQSATVPIK